MMNTHVSRLHSNSNFCFLFIANVLSPNSNIIILGADAKSFIPFNDIVDIRIHKDYGGIFWFRVRYHVMICTVNVISSYLESSTSNMASATPDQSQQGPKIRTLFGLKEPRLLKKAILSLKEQALNAATTVQPAAAAAAAACVTTSPIEMVATSMVDNNQEAVIILREIQDRLAQQNELLQAQRKTSCCNALS